MSKLVASRRPEDTAVSAHPKTEEWVGYASILRQNGFTTVMHRRWKMGTHYLNINFVRTNKNEKMLLNENGSYTFDSNSLVFETIKEFEKYLVILKVLLA